MTETTKRAAVREMEAAMRAIAQQTPLKPRPALAAGYAAWCVLYERTRELNS